MKDLIALTILSIFLVLGQSMAFASVPSMECETTRMTGKKVIVTSTKVTYVEEMLEQPNPRREIASLETSISNVRTKYSGFGVTKVLTFEGHKHTIHIENVNSPSDVNDYLSIKSPRGHEVVYPLNCKAIN